MERLADRQAHVLLLQRQPQLIAERTLEPLGGHLERPDEAHSGFDRDDKEVDQLRKLVLDLSQSALSTILDELRRNPVAERRTHNHAEEDLGCRDPGRRSQPEPDQREAHGSEQPVTKEPAGCYPVHAGRDELAA